MTKQTYNKVLFQRTCGKNQLTSTSLSGAINRKEITQKLTRQLNIFQLNVW